MTESMIDIDRRIGAECTNHVLDSLPTDSRAAKFMAQHHLTFSATGTTDVHRWFTSHSGDMIWTVQANVETTTGRLTRLWTPWEPRQITDVTKSRAMMMGKDVDGHTFGSSLAFGNLIQIAYNEDNSMLIAWNRSMRQVNIYWLAR